MDPVWQKILVEGGVATSVVLFVLKLASTWLKEYKRKLDSQKAKQAVVDAASVYKALQIYHAQISTVGMYLIYTENGGGIPKANKAIYCSTLYEMYNTPGYSISKFTQRVLTDQQSIEILSEAIQNGVHVFKETPLSDKEETFIPLAAVTPLDMESDNLMHTCSIHYVGASPDKIYYLVSVWDNIEEHPVEHHIQRLNLLVSHLRNIFEVNR